MTAALCFLVAGLLAMFVAFVLPAVLIERRERRRRRIESIIRELWASGEWAQVEEERRRSMSKSERDAFVGRDRYGWHSAVRGWVPE
jgi:hypothetical protein